MTESEFNNYVDETLDQLENRIEEIGVDIETETGGGILTLSFDNGTKIILNRQTPVQQLWVAARSGGFHFNFDAGSQTWIRDSDGEELFSALSRWCAEQAGTPVNLIG